MSRPAESVLPDPRQALQLRAALLDGDAALAAWEEWTAGVALDDLDWDCQRLLPLLYRNMARLGVESPDMDRLKGVYRHYWYANQLLRRDAVLVLRALHGAGVDTLVLKGLALSDLHYRDGGTRPMADVDVLVRRGDVARSVELLSGLGYAPYAERPLDLQLRTRHAICVRNGSDRELDLHWYSLYQSAPDDGFWERSVPYEVAGLKVRALCPADQLIHVCVHGLSGASPAPIRWLADAATVARSSELDWDLLVEHATERGCSVAVQEGLGHIRELLDVPVPADVLHRLAAARSTRAERWAHRTAVEDRTRHGAYYVFEWDRYRRLRRAGAPEVQRNFLRYVRDSWDVDSMAGVAKVLASKAVAIVRHGSSTPAQLSAGEMAAAGEASPRAG